MSCPMVLIFEYSDLNEVLDALSQLDYDAYKIGDVAKGSGQIILK